MLDCIPDGWRMFKRRLEVAFRGIPRYEGNSKKICEQIVANCWNGRYFQTSTGHFSQFYTRDFGWCVDSLMKLGYKRRIRQELIYAMNIFKKYKKITTTITTTDVPYDFPCYSPDSLAFFIRALRISNSNDIIKKNKDFLNFEIKNYFNNVIDKDTGLVNKNKKFSSMKDRYFRVSSCYDNVMTAVLKDDISKIKILDNPFNDYNYKRIIKDAFWNGDYFNDDLESNYVSGDANVFPYWTGIFTNKNMMKNSVNSIINDELDIPFPLKYTSKIPNTRKDFTELFLVPNSEGTCVWTQLGFMYIKVVSRINKELARGYIQEWSKVMEKYKNCIEIFDDYGRPYKSLFYHADDGMLWACMFLEL